jgi:uracil-DNA glycosylase
MASDKASQYRELVDRRKRCSLCPGLCNPSAVDGGSLDSDEIGPWSRWQGNLGAPIMIVGQDWGDITYFRTNHGQEAPRNPTNSNLVRLLRMAGYRITESPGAESDDPVFLTNAILCLKRGGLQAEVQREWFDNCGTAFLRPLIEIVRPRVLVTLGGNAFQAIVRAFGLTLRLPTRLRDLVTSVSRQGGLPLPPGTRLFVAFHPGARVINTHRSFAQQEQDWKLIGTALR